MGFDLLLILTIGLTQLGMSVIGIWWTFRPPRPDRHWIAAAAFGVVGVVGLGAVIWAGVRSNESSNQVEGRVVRIERTGTENSGILKALKDRISEQAVQLQAVQQENITLSKQNGRLLVQNIALDVDIRKIAGAADLPARTDQSSQSLANQVIRYLATIDQRLHRVEHPPRDPTTLYDGLLPVARVIIGAEQGTSLTLQRLSSSAVFDFSKTYLLQTATIKCMTVPMAGAITMGGDLQYFYDRVPCVRTGTAPQ
jgi:hypothetical protein